MFETKRQRILAVGAGAFAGLALMGGAAFAQTPGGTATPGASTAVPSATAPATGQGTTTPGQAQPDATPGTHDGIDCPHDRAAGADGASGGAGGTAPSSGTPGGMSRGAGGA